MEGLELFSVSTNDSPLQASWICFRQVINYKLTCVAWEIKNCVQYASRHEMMAAIMNPLMTLVLDVN